MNLTVDLGNSAVKVGIFDHQNLMDNITFADVTELKQYLQESTAENIIVSSVKTDADLVTSWAVNAKHKFILTHRLPLPVKNLYRTPETIGVDRLAGVCGAQQLFPSENCLVIDAGTCITYDFVDKEGTYHGGAISPGLQMRFQAVHTFTARLPLISPRADVALIGNTTETCIQSGVINGLLAEIDGVIAKYYNQFPGLRIILCGGDTRFFENQLKASIFASPELVLIGLNSILNFNVNR